jgi:hypothetical protein
MVSQGMSHGVTKGVWWSRGMSQGVTKGVWMGRMHEGWPEAQEAVLCAAYWGGGVVGVEGRFGVLVGLPGAVWGW